MPDETKIQNFSKLQSPKDKNKLRSVLGTLRHYGMFCKNFSSRAKILYDLLKKNVQWKWQSDHEAAFNDLKSEIPKGNITCYDQKKATICIFRCKQKRNWIYSLS